VIITFSGVDCAGKSTQIDELILSLNENNHPTYYLWSRGGYTLGIEMIKNIFRFFLGNRLFPSGKSKKRTKTMSNPIFSRIWLNAAILDLIFFYCILLRFKSFIGKIVICDRYVVDTYLDFSLNFPHISFEKMWLWRLLIKLHPKPALSFLFILPVTDSIERSRKKNEPFPDSKEFFEKRLNGYQNSHFCAGDNWINIDGLDSIELTKKIIKNKVFHKLATYHAS
jgi:thymidylate kinase